MDNNKIEEKGAKYIQYHCNLVNMQKLKLKSNAVCSTGTLFISQSFAVRNLTVLDLR